jgi:hypothetical protein
MPALKDFTPMQRVELITCMARLSPQVVQVLVILATAWDELRVWEIYKSVTVPPMMLFEGAPINAIGYYLKHLWFCRNMTRVERAKNRYDYDQALWPR